MARTRRDFIKSVGLGLTAWAVARPALAFPGLTELRSALQSNRDRIETLHVVFDMKLLGTEGWSEEAQWLMQGRTEFAYEAPGNLWVVCHREGMTSTEILQGDRFFSGLESPGGERPSRIVYDGPVGPRHKPGLSLDVFLPVPEDRPMEDLGSLSFPEGPAKVIGQGDRRYYVTLDEPFHLRRLERFTTGGKLGARVNFLEYERLAPGIHFPRVLLSEDFDGEGTPRSPVRYSVTEVRVNQALPKMPTGFSNPGR
ncbi:MAG TPA: hypothetical protein VLE27_05180 [Thermoanaerobaculia bacterium]|nr:hypothetical protein [Thermoanaerobaculia bacterium]